jgi:glucose-1-phosphate thymidylyltransferase
MKGILLAGGNASRLYPVTNVVSKQLLPIYNKPMIYYPLTTLMHAGIREILIISTPHHVPLFEELLGDGSMFGTSIEYKVQKNPAGLAEAFIIGENFIANSNSALILGDNLFSGSGFHQSLRIAGNHDHGGLIFGYQVDHPEVYGVVEFNEEFEAISIEEKPKKPKSNFAVPGLYFYDNQVIDIAKTIEPSDRGELEITDINRFYLNQAKLKVEILGPGTTWLDTGTFDSLMDASSFVRTKELRQGIKIGCPEEVAYLNQWISADDVMTIAQQYPEHNSYGNYLKKLVTD